jgi:hypothetical protein
MDSIKTFVRKKPTVYFEDGTFFTNPTRRVQLSNGGTDEEMRALIDIRPVSVNVEEFKDMPADTQMLCFRNI